MQEPTSKTHTPRGTFLIQMHHQWVNMGRPDRFEFVAQGKFTTREEFEEWARQVGKEHPLPEGAQWIYCVKDSDHTTGALTRSILDDLGQTHSRGLNAESKQ